MKSRLDLSKLDLVIFMVGIASCAPMMLFQRAIGHFVLGLVLIGISLLIVEVQIAGDEVRIRRLFWWRAVPKTAIESCDRWGSVIGVVKQREADGFPGGKYCFVEGLGPPERTAEPVFLNSPKIEEIRGWLGDSSPMAPDWTQKNGPLLCLFFAALGGVVSLIWSEPVFPSPQHLAGPHDVSTGWTSYALAWNAAGSVWAIWILLRKKFVNEAWFGALLLGFSATAAVALWIG